MYGFTCRDSREVTGSFHTKGAGRRRGLSAEVREARGAFGGWLQGGAQGTGNRRAGPPAAGGAGTDAHQGEVGGGKEQKFLLTKREESAILPPKTKKAGSIRLTSSTGEEVYMGSITRDGCLSLC